MKGTVGSSDDRSVRYEKVVVWVALEKLLLYFTGLNLIELEQNSFKRLSDEFGCLFVIVFGEQHVPTIW